MNRTLSRRLALALALAGYWLPWLTHPAAALRLNGYELSEWITFLPGVRAGSLPLTRLVFLLPLACLALLFALAAARPASTLSLPPLGAGPRHAPPPARTGLAAFLPSLAGPLGWLFLLVGLLCAFTVLPPYPYLLTAYADPEFQLQLLVAAITLIAVLLVTFLPDSLSAILQTVLALAGLAVGAWGLLTVRPLAAELLNAAWPIGLGWYAMLAGFGWLALLGLRRLFGPRE
jgi:hypothetical protein